MYTRNVAFGLIDKTKSETAGGCQGLVLYNGGNVQCTINKVLVLLPGMFISVFDENPEISDDTVYEFVFSKNYPVIVAPQTGATPAKLTALPGDPPPARDERVILIKSFLTKK
jgi:hypothetical protein